MCIRDSLLTSEQETEQLYKERFAQISTDVDKTVEMKDKNEDEHIKERQNKKEEEAHVIQLVEILKSEENAAASTDQNKENLLPLPAYDILRNAEAEKLFYEQMSQNNLNQDALQVHKKSDATDNVKEDKVKSSDEVTPTSPESIPPVHFTLCERCV